MFIVSSLKEQCEMNKNPHGPTKKYMFHHLRQSRVNILANTPPSPGGGRNKHISENEEEIKVFYCLALKNEEEIRKRWGKK